MAMHPLIDQTIVERIRSKGHALENAPDRIRYLEEHGLPYDREAENVIITGCMIPAALPDLPDSLRRIYDHTGFSYTFLSKEYCCGNYLYRSALKPRDDEALQECRELSREFIGRDIEMANKLKGKRLVIFCSPCYPIFKHLFPGRPADPRFFSEPRTPCTDLCQYAQATVHTGPGNHHRAVAHGKKGHRLSCGNGIHFESTG